MKNFVRVLLILIVLYLVVGQLLFSRKTDPSVYETEAVEYGVFYAKKSAFVEKQIVLQGLVVNSYYLLGIGFYSLQNAEGRRIGILCPGYPPYENQLIEIVAYVQPLLKLSTLQTIQVEVEQTEVILSVVK